MVATQIPVVVTGLGVTTPLGGDLASTWSGLLAGQSGVRALTADWAEGLPVRIAAPAAVDPAEVLAPIEARNLDRCTQLALVAAREAWRDAGAPDVDRERLGVVVATGVGGLVTLLAQYDVYQGKGPRRVSPRAVPTFMANSSAATIGLELGAQAGVHTPVSACASGAEALAYGLMMIRSGRADVVVCGGTEAVIHPLALAGFGQMMALSKRNDEPERASRPFDKNRDGFVLGEAAGILVLESAGHAARRAARVYCRLDGAGQTSDAHHIAQPEPEGRGAARAMSLALADAGLAPEQVVHLNAHATSTPQGDVAEAQAIRAVFGESAGAIAVSATKSMTGHLVGAAGAVEAAATVMALHTRTAPPTVNLDDPEDEIGLDVVCREPRTLPEGGIAAVSNSFGFGGHNISLVFRTTG